MTWTDKLKLKASSLTQGAFTVLLAVVAGGTSHHAVAQTIAPQAVVAVTAGEPKYDGPEGSWIYTVTIPGFTTFQGLETYAPGGGYSEADQLSFNPIAVASAGHGAWKKTGDKTFLLTYLNLTFDSFSGGTGTGYLAVEQKTTIDKTGNSYTGSGTFTYYGVSGQPIQGPGESGTFTITAQRIQVEAPKQ